MALKTGRPKKENPKNVEIGLRLTRETAEKLQKCADILKTSRTDIIEQGIEKMYKDVFEK